MTFFWSNTSTEARTCKQVATVLPVAMALSGCVETGDPNDISARVTSFQHAAKGAYSIIHDDLCGVGVDGLLEHAGPELSSRNLVAGFGAIGSDCERRSLAPDVTELFEQGHEIINHGWSHQALVPCESATSPDQECSETRPDYEEEIDRTRQWIEDNVGAQVTFFIFPFDSFDDQAIEYLKEHDYLGARAGQRGFNEADLRDPLRLNYDVYGPEWSIYREDYEAGDVESVLDRYVKDAIESGQWALRELHGVEDDSWETVPLDDYRAHLDFVAKKVETGALWMDTPTNVARYLQARQLCGTPTVEDFVLTFEDAQAACEDYVTELTVEITRDQLVLGLVATQDEKALATWSLDEDTAIVDGVDPTRPTRLDFDGTFTGRPETNTDQ